VTAEATEAETERTVTSRLVGAHLLGSIYRGLIDFQWDIQEDEVLDSDRWGLRVLGGSVDGAYVLRPQQDPGLTWSLVAERTAEAVSHILVDPDAEAYGSLIGTDFMAVPFDDPRWERRIARMHLQLMGSNADIGRMADYRTLFAAIEAVEGTNEAWRGLIVAMLRDPEFLTF
jgi:hypothetical protein